MANLQIKNVPEQLHNRLRRYAKEHRCTISDLALQALKREIDWREWDERFLTRPQTRLDKPASAILAEERADRDRDPS